MRRMLMLASAGALGLLSLLPVAPASAGGCPTGFLLSDVGSLPSAQREVGIQTDRRGNGDGIVCTRFVGDPDEWGDPDQRILLIIENNIGDPNL
jgi:hypothetical protein